MHKYTFFSNFLTHYQVPFCLEMKRLLGNGFSFVATEPIHQERIDMGFDDLNNAYSFVIRSYENTTSYNEAVRIGNESDVVIIGSAPELFVKKRITENKLTFRYSERILKNGFWRMFDPRIIKSLLKNHTRFFNKQLYMLCASAYTAGDMSLVGAYRGKCYKWGYFPEVRQFDITAIMTKKKSTKLSILWAGRFLRWKHPEKALLVARYLIDNGIELSLRFIGGGEMDKHLKSLMVKLNLENYVEFLGYLPPEAVCEEMEKSDIYLFTSDYNEGWGVVLNEAMNSGCAVVACQAAGSVPFLIKNGENGLIYKNNSMSDLYSKVLTLSKDPELRYRIGINAYNTINEMWNAEVAVERLFKISDSLLAGKDAAKLYADGPCSVANTKSPMMRPV
jgi:glycosyltransferase involved in cell wall biosynthesis